MAKVRLGVALLVPASHDRELDGLRRAVGDGALARIPPHLTLVPPVNVREDRLTDAHEILRLATAATRPFDVALGPPATFLPVNPVLFLPVGEGAGAVHALRDAVFAEPLARALDHPFVPHVTVADDAEPARIEAALVALADYRVRVRFDRVHLLQEQPGRIWESVGEWLFGAPAVIGRGGLPVELTTSEHPDPEAAAFLDREWRAAVRPIVVVARRDGRILGVATGAVEGDRALLSQLVVAPEVRGEGVAAHLLRSLESAAAERGALDVSALRQLPARIPSE